MNLTERQKQVKAAVEKHGGIKPAARALGVHPKTVQDAMRAIAKKDPAQHAKGAPLGYHLRGASTLLDGQGNVVQTWVKTARDALDPGVVLDLFRSAVEQSPPRKRTLIPRTSKTLDADLACVYPMGDPHLGMLAWAPETGADFDLKIAVENLYAAVDHLVSLAPAAKLGLLINVGDFFHADSTAGTTTKGTHVDVDSRWAKVLRAGIAVQTRCIDRMLEKHEIVEIDEQCGNHDKHTAIMLALCMAEHYRGNPRVRVNTSPSKYHYYEHGQCLIGTTHGDTAKPDKLPGIMAVDQREAWGRTQHHYWYTGHVHHQRVFEFPGCVVESVNTLAASDGWHAGQGYRSRRSMLLDVLHTKHGRVNRHEVGIEQVTECAKLI